MSSANTCPPERSEGSASAIFLVVLSVIAAGNLLLACAPANPPELTLVQTKQLKALKTRPDRKIDYSDIPPIPDSFWQTAIRNPYSKLTKTPTIPHREMIEAFKSTTNKSTANK